MSPPDVPGLRGVRLPAPAQEINPRPRQNSHGDSEPPVEADRPSRIEVEEFQHAVHAKYGKASFSGPAWVFLIGLLILSLGLLVYLATRHEAPPAASSTQCLTKDQFDESMRQRDERLARRFDTLETDTSYLKVAVRLVQDRLPPGK